MSINLLESTFKESSTNDVSSNLNLNPNVINNNSSNSNKELPSLEITENKNPEKHYNPKYNQYLEIQKRKLYNTLLFIKQINNQIEELTLTKNSYDKLIEINNPKKNERTLKSFKRKNSNSVSKAIPDSKSSSKNLNKNTNPQLGDIKNELNEELLSQTSKLKIDNLGIISDKKNEFFKDKKTKEDQYNYIINNLQKEYEFYLPKYNEKKKNLICIDESNAHVDNALNNFDKIISLKKYIIDIYYKCFIMKNKELINANKTNQKIKFNRNKSASGKGKGKFTSPKKLSRKNTPGKQKKSINGIIPKNICQHFPKK